MNVVIAAGGTGGHIFPGIALAEEFMRRSSQTSVIFVGTARGLESRVLKGIWKLVTLRSFSIKDRRGFSKFIAWLSLPISIVDATGLLWSLKPSLAIGIGGYAAGPLMLMASLFRFPTAIIEPNAYAGFTNRLLGRFVKRVFVAFEEASEFFPKKKVMVSGNPLRAEITALREERLRRRMTRSHDALVLFCSGGSQGARSLNQALLSAMEELGPLSSRLRVLHQAGTADDVVALRAAYEARGIAAEIIPFSNAIAKNYARADLVIARAGATTIAELQEAALPAILVPYPHAADDHQRYNAEAMVRQGGARMILDAALNGKRLAEELQEFLQHPEKLEAMRTKLEAAPPRNAAQYIVETCLKLVQG